MPQQLKIIVLVILVGAIALYSLQRLTTEFDIFSTQETVRLEAMGPLPVEDIYALKLFHALNVAAYDIGLFGNSRIISVGAENISLSDQRIFNFGLRGRSFEDSVMFIEKLSENSKLPTIVVISFDNLHIKRIFHAPLISSIFERLPNFYLNIRNSISENLLNETELWKYTGIFFANEWKLFTRFFSAKTLNLRLRYYFADVIPFNTDTSRYYPDGSRHSTASLFQRPLNYEPVGLPPFALERALQRLNDISGKGAKVLIFESPLIPKLAEYYKLNPDSRVSLIRRYFFNLCAQYEFINCLHAPNFGGIKGKKIHWENQDHPPKELLGKYLQGIITSSTKQILDTNSKR
jgi:hypothetical protein